VVDEEANRVVFGINDDHGDFLCPELHENSSGRLSASQYARLARPHPA
jgi:hypothetical protein